MPKVGGKKFPYTKAGRAAAKKAAAGLEPKAESKKAGRKEGGYSFAKNPNREFRGKKTGMKRPEGRKR